MFTQTLYAQGAEGGAMGAMAPQLLMMGAIFAIFYFLLIRPQKNQQKKLQAAIAALKKGDKIIIAGGMLAEYVSDKENGTIAVVKINADTKIEIYKSSISTVVVDTPLDAKADSKAKGKKEDKNAIKEELEKIEEKEKGKESDK